MALAKRIWEALDAIEAAHIPRLTSILAAGMDDFAIRIRDESRGVDLAPEFRTQMVNSMAAVWWDTASAVVNIMQDELKGAWPPEIKADHDVQLIVSRYIDQFGSRRASQVLLTTQKQVRNLIRGGMAQGEAADTVFGSFINNIPDLAERRSEVITRTEAHAASQFTSQKMAERSVVPLTKQWNSILDNRVRDFGLSGRVSEFNHRIMNGQELPLMEKFLVPTKTGGFEALHYPGDPAGSAGNIINCRCIQTYRKMD